MSAQDVVKDKPVKTYFTNVVLPGKSHLTAITPAFMPREYTDSLVRFIDSNDI